MEFKIEEIEIYFFGTNLRQFVCSWFIIHELFIRRYVALVLLPNVYNE